jgi:choline kinase
MIGVVLAAGTGRRLQPYTDELPKALVPVRDEDSETTPLDVILGNFAEIGLTDVAIVVGYAAEAVEQRKPALQERYGLTLELIHNDRATTWNNCYSLWCARDLFGQDVLLSNGDTIHPVEVEHALLGNSGSGSAPALLLAVDNVKRLGEEEMKLRWSAQHGVTRITKLMDPAGAYGEYIGVAAIFAEVGDALAEALQATWERDPSLYYEDGFQELIDRGNVRVEVQPIGQVPWIEIDDHADLARATDVLRELSVRRQGAPVKRAAHGSGAAQ